MADEKSAEKQIHEIENEEWLYSLDYVLKNGGPERVIEILQQLQLLVEKQVL